MSSQPVSRSPIARTSHRPVITTALHEEMQRCYLEYAMSVIIGRALPDARDGLKPVHRRILYAMHELGLSADRPYRKCARVVGDVLGKYHPHGDQAVYDALVRMVQTFSSRYPLLSGHGNFGSIDNDPAAAMRYTETRLSPLGDTGLLANLSEATVNFTGNFDNSQQEPVVLPAQLPLLLLNGSSGIAVGMATNIPPHNLGEVVDGLIALIDRPDLSDEKLLDFIPGPDFPTGGEIVGQQGIRDAFLTGRGSITMRGVVHFEEVTTGVKRKSTRPAIVVTEFPYQVAKSAWIEKLASLVNEGKIVGIADIRDESDREGVRVVIELKRDANRDQILAQIYRQTPLQSNFGAIFLALVDQRPVQLTLRQALQQFLDFRTTTLTRQYRDELERVETRLHLVAGLLQMLARLDEAIAILRDAPDGTTAKQQFQAEFGFSEAQANAVLAMPMRRLTGLEQQNLREEKTALSQERDRLLQLLGDERVFKKELKKELRSLKKRFGDERRTRIISSEGEVSPAPAGAKVTPDRLPSSTPSGTNKLRRSGSRSKDTPKDTPKDAPASTNLTSQANATPPTSSTPTSVALPLALEIPAEDTVLERTARGYVRRLSAKVAQQHYEQDQAPDTLHPEQPHELTIGEDWTIDTLPTRTDQQLISICRDGKAYPQTVGEIALWTGRSDRGVAGVNLLPPSAQTAPDTVLTQFILSAATLTAADRLLLVTEQARIKCLPLTELTEMTARGLVVQKLKDGDRLLDALPLQQATDLILASSGGRLLRLEIARQIPCLGRNTQGQPGLRLRLTEKLAGVAAVQPHETIAIVSRSGFVKPLAVEKYRRSDRGGIGSQAVKFMNKADGLVGVFPVRRGDQLLVKTNADQTLIYPMQTIARLGSEHAGQKLPGLPAKALLTRIQLCRTRRENGNEVV